MTLTRICLALLLTTPCLAQQTPTPGVLPPAQVQQLMPPSVFFKGQTATTQVRNSFGVRFANGGLVLAGLVDTGGYSTAVRGRYQFYLLNDTPIELGLSHLPPGAYGGGFLPDGTLLVMDLGGNELFRIPITHDPDLRRPRPLQIVPGSTPEVFRLYLGRDYVAFHPTGK
jgi:hypothetical protein